MSLGAAWLIWIAIYAAYALATAFIARMKNRDPLTFGVLGLLFSFFGILFGLIGILIALVVPAIRLENLTCSYLDTNKAKPEVVRGKLVPYHDRLVFTSDRKHESFSIFYSDVIGSRIIMKRERKREGLPGKMFGIANLQVLEIAYTLEGQQAKARFSVYKTATGALQRHITEMGILSSRFSRQADETSIASDARVSTESLRLVKPSMTGACVLLVALALAATMPFAVVYFSRYFSRSSAPETKESTPTHVEGKLNPVQVIIPSQYSSPLNWTCYDIAPVDEGTVWACGSNGVVARIDGEGRWVARLLGEFSDFIDVSAPDKDNVWVLDAKGRIACSHDSGKTFNELEFKNENIKSWAFRQIRAVDTTCVWLLSEVNHVLRTTDAGLHWGCYELLDTQHGVSDDGPIQCFMPVDRHTCWAAKRLWQLSEKRPIDSDHDCFVYKTTDGGESWELTSSRGFPHVGLIEARGAREAFILAGVEGQGLVPDLSKVENVLLVTLDEGKTWSKPLLRNVSCVDLADADTLWAVLPGDPQSRVLLGTNAGSQWTDHPVDVPLTRLTLNDTMWIGPDVVGISRSSAWVLGTGSFWWAAARTTDAGRSWTYYDQQEP